ncbi:hypothetical protein EYF80_029365 [Liparis tanakae]|uniref:Uncharacterized protein n=1 Tax=Liparis tanakae TaxID=230148 RepID=A0A4Z2H3J2_9TELE|nr:hypothetical protein EYF80_029365 [Liparis tanakae]
MAAGHLRPRAYRADACSQWIVGPRDQSGAPVLLICRSIRQKVMKLVHPMHSIEESMSPLTHANIWMWCSAQTPLMSLEPHEVNRKPAAQPQQVFLTCYKWEAYASSPVVDIPSVAGAVGAAGSVAASAAAAAVASPRSAPPVPTPDRSLSRMKVLSKEERPSEPLAPGIPERCPPSSAIIHLLRAVGHRTHTLDTGDGADRRDA